MPSRLRRAPGQVPLPRTIGAKTTTIRHHLVGFPAERDAHLPAAVTETSKVAHSRAQQFSRAEGRAAQNVIEEDL